MGAGGQLRIAFDRLEANIKVGAWTTSRALGTLVLGVIVIQPAEVIYLITPTQLPSSWQYDSREDGKDYDDHADASPARGAEHAAPPPAGHSVSAPMYHLMCYHCTKSRWPWIRTIGNPIGRSRRRRCWGVGCRGGCRRRDGITGGMRSDLHTREVRVARCARRRRIRIRVRRRRHERRRRGPSCSVAGGNAGNAICVDANLLVAVNSSRGRR